MKKLALLTLTFLTTGAAYALPLGNPADPALYSHGLFYNGYCGNGYFGNGYCGNGFCGDGFCGDGYFGDGYYGNGCYGNGFCGGYGSGYGGGCMFDPCFCWWDAWKFRIGYYGDFVFNRNLRIDGSGLGQGNVIREVEVWTNAGYIALNFCNRVDVFGTVGATNLRLHTSEITFVGNGNAEGELFTDTHFSWSVGARAILFNYRCFTLGIEGQYFRSKPHLTKYISFSTGQFNYFNENNDTKYQEWQLGVGVSYQFTTSCPKLAFVPYVGAMWSRVRWRTDNFQFLKFGTDDELFTIFNMKHHKPWSYAIGLTTVLCDTIGWTVEGRFAGQKALYVNGQISF